MTYEYQCVKCDYRFDVLKPARDMDVNEFCPDCGSPAERKFVPSRVYITGASVEHAEYNPGLGCVTKNKRDREEQAKRRGLVEVGNDYSSGEKMQTTFDTARTEKLNKRYEGV